MSLEVVVRREEGVSHLICLIGTGSPLLSSDQSTVSIRESVECRCRVLEVRVLLMTYHQVNKTAGSESRDSCKVRQARRDACQLLSVRCFVNFEVAVKEKLERLGGIQNLGSVLTKVD